MSFIRTEFIFPCRILYNFLQLTLFLIEFVYLFMNVAIKITIKIGVDLKHTFFIWVIRNKHEVLQELPKTQVFQSSYDLGLYASYMIRILWIYWCSCERCKIEISTAKFQQVRAAWHIAKNTKNGLTTTISMFFVGLIWMPLKLYNMKRNNPQRT